MNNKVSPKESISNQANKLLFAPDLDTVLLKNTTLEIPYEWRKDDEIGRNSWSRRYLFVPIKLICLLMLVLTRVTKRVLPIRLASETLLNKLSVWFMSRCVSLEAQRTLFRHFALENSIIDFVIRNIDDESLQSYYHRPASAEEVGDHKGTNATLLHDAIVLNLFAELSNKSGWISRCPKGLEKLDFSGLHVPEPELKKPLILGGLDYETSLYIIVLFIALFVEEKKARASVHSLFLDESLMIVLSKITGEIDFQFWTSGLFSNFVRIPLDPVVLLNKHIRIHEYAYCKLLSLRDARRQNDSECYDENSLKC